ncbi:MAG: hypothetical protein ACKOFW_09645, partial [Planctomycetaceae bacterium]
RLKDAALAAGGRDNVTLLVADFSLPDAAIGETTRSGIQPPVSPNPWASARDHLAQRIAHPVLALPVLVHVALVPTLLTPTRR